MKIIQILQRTIAQVFGTAQSVWPLRRYALRYRAVIYLR
jgi:hypothetical protein